VGDEAMAEVAIQRLVKLVGEENLILGCANPDKIFETYGIKSFSFYHATDKQFFGLIYKKPLSFAKSVLSYCYQVLKADKLVVCGGGNMTSIWPGIL